MAGLAQHGVANPWDAVLVLTLACPAGSMLAGLGVFCLWSRRGCCTGVLAASWSACRRTFIVGFFLPLPALSRPRRSCGRRVRSWLLRAKVHVRAARYGESLWSWGRGFEVGCCGWLVGRLMVKSLRCGAFVGMVAGCCRRNDPTVNRPHASRPTPNRPGMQGSKQERRPMGWRHHDAQAKKAIDPPKRGTSPPQCSPSARPQCSQFLLQWLRCPLGYT